MPGFIPQETLDDIRSRVDIVDIISDYVQLKKKGRNYVGPCPFHREKDPSFTVSAEKQIFYCFGCGAGGNVFKFLMLYEGLSFQEAVEALARRAGIALEITGHIGGHRRWKKRDLAYKVNALARDFFQQFLNREGEAAPAREYLLGRGLSADTVSRFQLGFAPGNWNGLVNFLKKKGFSAETLVEIGLASPGKKGAYDRFRSRIMFPICDVRGNIVGFGGRVIGKGEPKYLNTPETDYFNKSSVLYGLNEARRHIREYGNAVIMEGYMDVISAHQYGIGNAVASLGTSLTREQVQLLMRYTRDVIIAYDADAAGVAATLRGLDLMQELGCRVRVVTIPDAKDPDEFLQAHGVAGWQDLIAGAESLLEYKLKQVSPVTAGRGNSKAQVLEQVLPNLANMQNEVERAEGIKLLAARLHTSWDAVAGEYSRFIKKKRKKRPNSDKITKIKHNISQQLDARTRAEKMLLRLMLDNPELVLIIQKQLGENFFKNPVYKRVFEKALPLMERNDYCPAVVFDVLEESDQKVLGDLLMETIPDDKPAEILPSYIKAMQRFLNKERRESLMDTLVEAEKVGDQKRVRDILEELQTFFK